MKKRTKKIGSLLLSAVMAISAVPVVSFSAAAAPVLPDFDFEIRTNAEKSSRSDSITITQADLAGGYTFSAGGYIVSGPFPESSKISNAAMSWRPVDSEGNSAYKYIHFANVQAKQSRGDETTTTLSDGTNILSKWPVYCLTTYSEKTGKVSNSGCSQFTENYLKTTVGLYDVFYDGKGGAYFTDKDGKRIDCTMIENEDGTTSMEYPYNDLSTGEPKTGKMTTAGFDKSAPADTPVPSMCNIDLINISSPMFQRNTFIGQTSDELPYTTFDVIVSPDTPTGTYYIALNDYGRNFIGTNDYGLGEPANMEYIKDSIGNPIGTTRNDKENWLKVEVQNGEVTTTSGTTTTTGDTTTTTSGTTTTIGTTTGGPKPGGYTWEAGEYWVKPGDTDFGIIPRVYNDPGDLTALKLTMKSSALTNGAIKPTAAGNMGMEFGEAYPDFADMVFTASEMLVAGSAIFGVDAAEDGSSIATMLYDVADEAAVKAAAEKAGLTLKSDAEHGSYYSFPLDFDPAVDPALGSPRCEAVLANEQRLDTTYVSGVINIIIPADTTTTTTTITTTTDTTTTTTTTSGTGTTTTTTSTTTTTTTTTSGEIVWNDLIGDTNLDGRVGVQDIICLNKYLLGQITLNPQAMRNATCKDDGSVNINEINSDDLMSLMRYLVDFIPSLPEA